MSAPKLGTDALLALLAGPPALLRAAAAMLLVALMVGLFHGGAQPHAVELIPPPWDKLVHMACFGGMAGLAWVWLGGSGPIAGLGAIAAAVIVCLLWVAGNAFRTRPRSASRRQRGGRP